MYNLLLYNLLYNLLRVPEFLGSAFPSAKTWSRVITCGQPLLRVLEVEVQHLTVVLYCCIVGFDCRVDIAPGATAVQ